MREKIEAPAIANRRGFAFSCPLVALRHVLQVDHPEKIEALVITARRGFVFSFSRRRKPRTGRGLGEVLDAAYSDAGPEQLGSPSSDTFLAQCPVKNGVRFLAAYLATEVNPVMHGRRVVAVTGYQGEQYEKEYVVQHLDAGEVGDEA